MEDLDRLLAEEVPVSQGTKNVNENSNEMIVVEDEKQTKGQMMAGGIHLNKYEQKFKGLKHLGLTVDKNVRLKSRNACGCCCEIILPVVFMVFILAGFQLAENFDHPASDYVADRPFFNATDYVKNIVCLQNDNLGSLPNTLDLDVCPFCPPEIIANHFNNGTNAVCGDIRKAEEVLKFQKIMSDYVNMTQPTDIMHLDAYIILTDSTEMNVTTLNSYIHIGGIQFALGVGVPCEAGQNIIKYMQKHYMLFNKIYDPQYSSAPSERGSTCEGVWDTEKTAVNFAKGDGADKTWAVVVINQLDAQTHQYDFTIRMNITATPYTRHDKTKSLGKKPYVQYMVSGFATLQNAISLAIQDIPPENPFISVPMPNKPFRESEFYRRAGNMLPLVMTFAFMYPVSRLVSLIVLEKEQRQREAMLIMGLSKTSFYGSWFVTYIIMNTISCILITLMTSGSLFQYSSSMLVFVMFFFYAMSVVAMSLMFSVFFSKARISAVAAPVLMMSFSIPKFVLQRNELTASDQRWVSLLAPSAFGYGAQLLCKYEGEGTGAHFSDFTSDEYSFGTCVAMLFLDTLIYLALGWYLDNVLPSEYGVKKHPLFPIFKLLGRNKKPQSILKTKNLALPRCPLVEEVSESMAERERIKISTLTKRFNVEGEENLAVNHLGYGLPDQSVRFYEGQIQCILGHNGAGKTTLINMLTGMIEPTAGDCQIWGKSILTDIDKIRQDVGMCPQHNILWEPLTCREHLTYFGRLKGVPSEELKLLVDQMLDLVNLGMKKDARASSLSGGQKRKLSVAISLIGGSKLVFLDEPTAGMDVESRRAMWHLLRRPEILRGRCIVLTTHYMDEADLLGDSVIIMEKGSLHSWGSPFFLKQKLGVGYNLSMAMQTGCSEAKIEEVIKKYVPNLNLLSCSGNELKFQLPMFRPISDEGVQALTTDNHCSPVIKEQILSTNPSSRPELIDTLIRNPSTDSATLQTLNALFSEARAQAVFPDLFDELDDNKETLLFESYGVGVTTLEEVFMKIAVGEDPSPKRIRSEEHRAGDENTNFKLYSIADSDCPPDTERKLQIRQFKALFAKRFHCARRDKRLVCFQFVVPILVIAGALGLSRFEIPSQPSISLGVAEYDQPIHFPYGDDDSELFDGCKSRTHCGFPESQFNLEYYGQNSTVVSKRLLEEYDLHEDIDRPVSICGNDSLPSLNHSIAPATPITLMHNSSWYAAFPSALNMYHNARLRSVEGVTASLQARNHPLPFSNYVQKLIDSFLVLIIGIIILLPFTLLPSNYMSFIVKERECKAKHLQLISGVKLSAYWFSSFLFDLLLYCCTLMLALILFFIGGRDEFVGSPTAFCATFFLFLFYGISSIVCSYAVSFFFQSHTQAQTVGSAGNLVTGFVLVIASFILDELDSTRDINAKLKYINRLVPSYCLGEGIINLSSIGIDDVFGYETSPLDWDTTGVQIMYMALTTPIYILAIILLERMPTLRFRDLFVKDKRMKKASESAGGDAEQRVGLMDSVHNFDEDPAVAQERIDIENGREGDLVTVKELRKVWPAPRLTGRPKVAVQSLSFGVQRGELFAFLGTNGAGKTTTLSVLSGEYQPTSGSAKIAGHDVVSDSIEAKKHMGLCPQFDALLDQLTPDEHLSLYADLRGIPFDKKQESIETLITSLDLTAHRSKKSKALSGGNKRKLSVAIALIGGPPVIFLDEPSAGMDPVARRGLWSALEDACRDRCVVLTTHHLEEVEGLSHLNHRVTIMVDGRLQCLGSLQQVKSRFGDAYELCIKLEDQSHDAAVRGMINQLYPNSTLEEAAYMRLTYKIPMPVSLSKLFRTIEDNRSIGISEYSINATSLEQVFIRISERAQRDMEGNEILHQPGQPAPAFVVPSLPPPGGSVELSMLDTNKAVGVVDEEPIEEDGAASNIVNIDYDEDHEDQALE
eukprot:TRINITY_DN817_c1_g1_i1.p1 TRINITY_DN817_c1_g1~~TRINITY_DN817_c1_g1_i1.p1  ORF type:complete len:1922 (+),score=363.69 TRINITY_DN817_c1_g1_i1:42-5807(+)